MSNTLYGGIIYDTFRTRMHFDNPEFSEDMLSFQLMKLSKAG